jgi:hypothetical protein
MDCLIQWINGEVKAECLSTLASSRGIVSIRFGSMGAANHVTVKFDISGVGVWRRL